MNRDKQWLMQPFRPEQDPPDDPRHRMAIGIGTREDWQRLGGLLIRRRQVDIGYRYRNHFRDGQARRLGRPAPAHRTILEIENGSRERPDSFTAATLEMVAPFYETTSESMLAVVRGEAGRLDRVRPPGTAGTGPGDRAARVQPYYDAIVAHILALDPPGEVLFPDSERDAQTWDLYRSWGDPEQRRWLLADLHCSEAERADPAALAG